MRYAVGVDGGTSRTDAIVVDETGRRLGRGHSGPIYAGGGYDDANARVHLLDCVGEALANSGITGAQVASIFIGCANWTAKRAPEVIEWLSALEIPAEAVTVSDDGDQPAAWAAARFPDPAIMITLGSFWGSSAVAFGREIPHLTDGLGVDQGNAALAEGSTIGSRALHAAIVADFGGEPTSLGSVIGSALSLDGGEALRQWASENRAPRDRARICAIAAEAAQAGDEVARQLFEDAGVGLAQATIPMAYFMGCVDQPFVIALSGNVWKAGALIIEPFRRAIHDALPKASIHVNALSPEEGAALLALRIAHLQIDKLHG